MIAKICGIAIGRFVINGICMDLNSKIPPRRGFVINGNVTPEKTTMLADIILKRNLRYGERSYLSSRIPTKTTVKPEKRIITRIEGIGLKRIKDPTNKAAKIASPPARGIGFL